MVGSWRCFLLFSSARHQLANAQASSAALFASSKLFVYALRWARADSCARPTLKNIFHSSSLVHIFTRYNPAGEKARQDPKAQDALATTMRTVCVWCGARPLFPPCCRRNQSTTLCRHLAPPTTSGVLTLHKETRELYGLLNLRLEDRSHQVSITTTKRIGSSTSCCGLV